MAADVDCGTASLALHILMVPFQQEGHVNGTRRLSHYMVELASQAAVNLVVTFAYPARFYHLGLKRGTISASEPDDRLQLRSVDDGLPRDEDLPLTTSIFLTSIPVFQQNVKLLLDQLQDRAGSPGRLPPVSCIVSDTFVPWTQDLAHSAHIPRVEYWTSTAATYSMGSQLSTLVTQGVLPLPKNCWVDLETKWTLNAPLIEGVPGLPPFPATDLPQQFVQVEEVTQPEIQFMLGAFGTGREAYAILVNSIYDMERHVVDALQATGMPIHAVGPMAEKLQAPIQSTGVADVGKPKSLSWLDMQAPRSVIYIALGSGAKFNQSELHAVASGLEACKQPFLWVIRNDALPAGSALTDVLPTGFLQRTVEKGTGLIISWVPQTEVLAHASIAAFFSHCGWNSTLECMWEGIPLVACPRGAEQRSNARWIVEVWKIGVALERQVDGSFTQEAVENAFRQLLSGDEALRFKERALHTRDMARHALQVGGCSFDSMVGFLKKLHATKQAT